MHRVLSFLVTAATLAGCPGGTSDGADAGRIDDGGASDSPPASDAGGTIDVPAIGSPPVASIYHPGDGEDRVVGMGVPMIGEATDAEDGSPPDSALVWTSDLEGAIGTGRMFTWTPTMVGTQIVTLTVTDSDAQVGTDTVTIDVVP